MDRVSLKISSEDLSIIRRKQLEEDFKKSIIMLIALFLWGLFLIEYVSYKFQIEFIMYLGIFNLVVSIIMSACWFLSRHTHNIFIHALYLNIPFLIGVLEEVYLISNIKDTIVFFLIFAIIWFLYISIYETSYKHIIVLLLIITVAGSKGMSWVFDQYDLRIVAILYSGVICLLSIILDKHNVMYKLMLKRLREVNDSMYTEIQNTVRNVKEQEKLMKEVQTETVVGLANLIEYRSGETGSHVKNTQSYMRLLTNKALEIGLYKDELDVEYANMCTDTACLHDIGKIVVSDVILNAPRRLTDEEYEIMKTHTIEGEKAIDGILGRIEDKEYIEIAKEIAGCHHERWDGQGYPRGLKELEIPLCARFMAIADVYDALISKRCYKEPMSKDKALSIIEEGAGSQFDPILAKLFVSEMRK